MNTKSNLLKSIFISLILVMGVSNAWAASTVTGGHIYFDELNSGFTGAGDMQFWVGHNSYSCSYSMSKIDNTKLWYCTAPNWSDATYFAFTSGANWGGGNQKYYDRIGSNPWKSAIKENYALDSSSKLFVFRVASTANKAAVISDSPYGYQGTSYTSLNKTITIKAKVSTDGGSSYSEASTPAKLTGSSKVFTSTSSCAGISGASATLNAGSSSTTFKAGYTANTTLTAVAATGYTFAGWYTDSKVSSDLESTVNPAGATTYYAYYKAHQYTVKFDANGGTGSMSNQSSHTYGVSKALTANAFTRTGYTFAGWNTKADGTGTKYTDKQEVSNLSSTDGATITLYAQWTANISTVTWDANGGTVDPTTSTYTYDGDPVALPTPKREGYTFNGWYTEKTDGKRIDNIGKGNNPTSNITYYAQWTANTYTVTLDQTGATTQGTASVTATYDADMPSATMPTKTGYVFGGYYDQQNGKGTKYYNAEGTSECVWDKAKDATLYAYFKAAEITINLNAASFEPNSATPVIATATLKPEPVGTTSICWELLYNDDTSVAEHAPQETGEPNQVQFNINDLATGTYQIKATLREGEGCTGTIISHATQVFTITSDHTITIKYVDENGQTIKASTTQSAHASTPVEIKAPEIGGYKFVNWELGDGIFSESDLKSETIEYTAIYDGYLTAKYEKKKLIFLDLSNQFGETEWTEPHIYLYSGSYWDNTNGTGGNHTNCIANGAMTRVGTSNIWYYDYESVKNFNGYVAFTPTDQSTSTRFKDTEAIYRYDFSSGTPVFVPAQGQIPHLAYQVNGTKAKYYNKGHWTKYMGGTGYTLKIYNKKENERTEVMSVPFTGSSLYLPFTAIADLEEGKTYGYKIVRDNDKWYKNDANGTMTSTSCTNWPFVEDNSNGLACGIQTVATGDHTFTLTLNATTGNLEVSVDYPAKVGNYRILYTDDVRDGRYKPSQIISKNNKEPLVSFFIRPNDNPTLKVQSAAHITDGGVTWYTADNHIYFKPNDLWKSDNARFAAYFYNGSKNEWKELTKNGDIYSCEKPSGYTHVIFVRLNPVGKGDSKKNNGLHWEYKWNQTGHLKLTTENLYTLNEGEWGNKLYLKPNSYWLQKDGDQKDPRFAAYFFNSNSDYEWVSMGNPVDGVYSCDIPAEVNKNVIFCRMNGGDENNNWDNKYNQSSDLTVPTDGKTLYTVKDNTWDKGGGSWSVKEGSWSTISGSITDLSAQLKEKLGELDLTNITETEGSVFNIHLSNNDGTPTIEKVAFYTGNYYIRVDAVDGKWYDYKTNPDNLMTYSAFSESKENSFGEKFSHYKTKWCEAGTNVKFTIANDYSHCISDTLAQDINSLGNLTDEGTLLNNDIYDVNIRFMWNWKTNKISRAYVGPAGDKQSQFLMLKACEEIQDAEGNKLNPAEGDILDEENNIYAARFADTQNWIYERTIQVKPRTRVKLYASYPNGYHIYIENNTGWKDVALYAFKNNGDKPLGNWPGVQPTRTVEIEGKTYYDFPVNKYVFGSTLIFNNTKNSTDGGQQKDDYQIQTIGDYYLTASSSQDLSPVKFVSTTVEATAQYFRGEYAEGSCADEHTIQILGGEGETWNTIRVIYDFKTNRLMAAWMPNNNEIDTERSIESDVMIIRDHQNAAQCITFANDDSKLTAVKTVYGVMRFNRWILNNRGGADNLDIESCTKVVDNQTVYDHDITNQNHPVLTPENQKSQYERALYFISFPFDVHLSDVFGFGTYGQHWIIEYYDGLKRATEGYWIDSDPNWKYVTDPANFVLEKYKGYILCLNLGKMAYDNTDFWAHNISQVELFFPSTTTMEEIAKAEVTMPELGDEYLCKINRNTPEGDRRVKDSYWRCIGVPSYANYSNVLKDEEGDPITWQTSYKTFPFLYKWNKTDNTLTPQSTTNFQFETMHAYLVQNGGKIHWSAVNATPDKPNAGIIAKVKETTRNYEWRITLTQGEKEHDQAFVRLSDDEQVTTEFDFNQDLSKEFNYGRSDIYTLIGYEKAAANSLPLSEQTTLIPLGLSIEYNGDYTIAMPGRMENIGVTLIDTESNTRTNLSAGMEYTLTLKKGDYNNRFFIEISPIQQTPTDIEYVTGDSNSQDNVRKVLIDNILYIVRDGQIFDARGARVK